MNHIRPEKRSVKATVSFTPSEWEQIKTKAKARNQRPSVYVRNMALDMPPMCTPKEMSKIRNMMQYCTERYMPTNNNEAGHFISDMSRLDLMIENIMFGGNSKWL